MFKNISIENILYFLFFTSLILFDNHINSKIIIGIGLISLIVFSKNKFKSNIKLNYPLLLFFLLILISLLYTKDLKNGFKEIEGLLIIPTSILIFSYRNKKEIFVKHIGIIFIFIVLLATIY